jgi:predicted TIM-barrel fold metal-dependent hydrolase
MADEIKSACRLPRPEDREFFERELNTFVPERVFDAHCHLWVDKADSSDYSSLQTAGLKDYRRLMNDLLPGRKIAALFIPLPDATPDRLEKQNEWISRNVRDSHFRGSFLIKPQDDPEWVRQEVRRLKLCGLKCYHSFAKTQPTWEADIPEYLPEPVVKVANEEGWVITLHMVKSQAVADPGNIHWIRHYCKTYPNMKLILAHGARAFQPAHALAGLPQLVGLENLYFDASANPEPVTYEAIIRLFGHQRLLYGSDFPVSHLRGRSIGVADTFLWLYENSPVWKEKHTQIHPVFVGFEVMRGLKWACWSARLDDSAVEDIFWNNAAQLFNIVGDDI